MSSIPLLARLSRLRSRREPWFVMFALALAVPAHAQQTSPILRLDATGIMAAKDSPSCDEAAKPRPGAIPRESTRPGGVIDACGRLRLTTGSSLAALVPPLLDVSAMANARIDSMMVYASIFGYTETYSPGGPVRLIAHAQRYYLDDGRSWESGAGSFYPTSATFHHVETSGETLRYVLSPPADGMLYSQTDYNSGDHSAQGRIDVEGPLVIVALAGATHGMLTGHGRLVSNDATWYGEPRFNYYNTTVGSLVPFRMRYQLSGATFTPGLFTTTFVYGGTGTVDFAHAVRPALLGLEINGPPRIPHQSTMAYHAIAEHQGGARFDVTEQATWSVTPKGVATISEGVLTVGTVTGSVTLTLRAAYERDGVHVEDVHAVVVRDDFYDAEPLAWPMYQADSRHTGQMPVTPSVSRFRLLWQRNLGQPLNPVTGGDGRVFCTGITYFAPTSPLQALAAGSGATLWSAEFGDVFSVNPPSYAYGNVYVQTGNHGADTWLHAFDAGTGERVFQSPHSAQWERYFAPTIEDGKVYVNGGSYGGMYAFDALTGGQLWFSGLPQYDQWTPAIGGEYAYAYVGDYSPGLYAVHRDDGQQAFMIPDPNFSWNGWSMNLAPVVGAQDDVLAIHGGRLISFDVANQRIRWQLSRAFQGQPSVADEVIYAIDGGALLALGETTGATLWSWRPPSGSLQGAIVITSGIAFVATPLQVYAVSLTTHGQLWSYPVSGHLAVANGCLYVASATGQLSAFELGIEPALDPAAATNPRPADAATVIRPVTELAWDVQPVATSYRVFFGNDSAEVAAATAGSPLQFGEVTSPSIAAPYPLALGATYYWRVDVVGFTTTAPGRVWRFTVAPLVVNPKEVAASGITHAPITPVVIQLSTDGPPQAWSVVETAPWLTLDHVAGTTPDAIWLSFDGTGLAPGEYRDTLRFTAGVHAFTVPVTLKLFQSTVTQMVADLERPFVYALSPGSGQADDAFLLFVSTETDLVTKVLPIGRNPTDMAVNPVVRKLYVSNWGQPVIRVVDLVNQFEETPLAVGTTDVYKLNAGRQGRLYTEGFDQWVNLHIIYPNGGILSSTQVREGDGASDPTGQWYYHCDNNISNAHITRYDMRGDAPIPAGTSAEHPYGSRNLVISGDGSRLFWRGYVYDAALTETGNLGAEIHATTLHGDVAFSASHAINPVNGAVLATLPVSTTVMAVSGDQTKLFSYDPATRAIVVTPMSEIAPVPGPGLNPDPPHGATVVRPLEQLSWDLSPMGLSYRVFFGSDSAAVASAVLGSPLLLDEVFGSSIPLDATLTLGATYYWRVDVMGFSGGTTGAVWRFTVAPLQVAPKQVVVTTVTGAPIAPVTLSLTTDGAPQAWSVVETASWLTLDHAAGGTPDLLQLSFDPAGLAAGEHRDTLRFTAGAHAFVVPVTLELFQMSVTQMVADFERPYVYALHPGSGQFDDAFLLFVSTETDVVTRVIPIGKNPTDMTVHAGEGRLYVTNHGQPVTRVVDLATQTELAPLALGTDVYKINAGRPGRLYTEELDQWIYLRTIQTSNGATLASTFVREGDGATDPTGQWYYHCDNNISNAHITRFNIAGDTPAPAGESAQHPYGSRNLVIAGDGSRLFWQGYVYDAALTETGNLGTEIYATTLHGDVAFSGSQAINPVNGGVLATLPVATTVMAVSGDQAKLFSYDPAAHAIVVTPMSEIAPVPGPGLNPDPADGATVVRPLERLAWDISPVALSYRVYFGNDSAAVAAAQPGSPLQLGEVTTPSIPLAATLTLGASYYWRVDVVGFSSTTAGAVWRFTVAPLQVSPKAVAVTAVTHAPIAPVTLSLTDGGTPQSWSAVETASWLALDHAAGSTPDQLQLTFDPTGLTAGEHRDTLWFTAGVHTFPVPVTLTLFEMTLTQMVTDYERPYVYALHAGSGQFDDAFLLFVSTETGLVSQVIPIGKSPTDMALHAAEGRLYVSNWGQPVTRVVDLATQAELAPLALGTDVYKINAGRPGRVYAEGFNQWVYISTINTANGATLWSTSVREGDGATDPTGQWYYHCDNNISNAHITRYDISGDTPVPAGASAEHPYGSRNLVISGDGSRLFWRGYVYDAALTETGNLGAEIYATTLHGDVAFSTNQAINPVNGGVLATLPVATTVMAMSGDQTKLLSYDPAAHAIVVTPMSEIAPVPGPGLNPDPADGSTVVRPLEQLAWDISPVALSYRVYFGTDPAAVAAATPGSPLQLGQVTSPSIPLAATLTLGAIYYWRVDVVGFSSTTTGAVWRFTVAPLQVSPKAVVVTTVTGAPTAPVTLSLTTDGAPQGWSVVEAASWLSLDHASGSTPGTLQLSFNPSGLPAGEHRDTLRFTAGAHAFAVPVLLRVIQMTVTQMVTDHLRPYIYALHPGSGQFDDAFLLFVNTETDLVTKVIPIGKNPTDMAVHAGEGRLYVTNWGQPLTRVVDLETQTELPPLALGTDVYKINAGRPGRVYAEGFDQWINISTINTANGATLATTFVREGDGAIDPTGQWYYHCDNNISNAHITRYDISSDTPVPAGTSAEHPYGSRNLVISADGGRLFWRGYVYDAALTELRNLGAEVHAAMMYGEVAFTQSHAIDVATGAVLAALPVPTTVMAVSGDQRKLFYYDPVKHSIRDSVLNEPTSAMISLVSTDVRPDRVRITWHTSEPSGPLYVHRAVAGEWSVVGSVVSDGGGEIAFEDLGVAPATTYVYRLSPSESPGMAGFAEVTVTTPAAARFRLFALSPNPVTSSSRLRLRFSLPRAAATKLAIVDVQGREVWRQAFATLDAGEHDVGITPAHPLHSGTYFVVLDSGGQRATERFVFMR